MTKEYKRLWYLKNKDRISEISKQKYRKNKKKLLMKRKLYYLKNKFLIWIAFFTRPVTRLLQNQKADDSIEPSAFCLIKSFGLLASLTLRIINRTRLNRRDFIR